MEQPEIEPGWSHWQAQILPLHHRESLLKAVLKLYLKTITSYAYAHACARKPTSAATSSTLTVKFLLYITVFNKFQSQ